MLKVLTGDGQLLADRALPLLDTQATRQLECTLASTLPPHTLMKRAGAAVAAMACAVAPHAQVIWIACGPGNNGGDGLMAAALLANWAAASGAQLTVSWCGNENHMPADARFALQQARNAGVIFSDHPPERCDLGIDALLGLGIRQQHEGHNRTPPSTIDKWVHCLHTRCETLLCVDLPSSLDADTGTYSIAPCKEPSSLKKLFCLTFLTLKPGLFTAQGRDFAGEIWFDDLGASALDAATNAQPSPAAWLGLHVNETASQHHGSPLRHNTHKGLFGDVWVLGGQGLQPSGVGMTGAAMLAAKAALHGQAGRVLVAMLDAQSPSWDATQPELMLRSARTLQTSTPLPAGTWVCGCGGGEAIQAHLPKVLAEASQLVLDADALNALSASATLMSILRERPNRGQITVLTPHPLEAARLLNWSTAQVQSNRLEAARVIATQNQCICVLKGSGTILATPSGLVSINPSGNSRLSTAGTGDVLAGMLGASLSRALSHWPNATRPTTLEQHATWLDQHVLPAVAAAVWAHGRVADTWPSTHALTASQLAEAFTPFTPPTSSQLAAR